MDQPFVQAPQGSHLGRKVVPQASVGHSYPAVEDILHPVLEEEEAGTAALEETALRAHPACVQAGAWAWSQGHLRQMVAVEEPEIQAA